MEKDRQVVMIQREPRSIFRAEAVQRYARSQGQATFPRLVCPRTFLYLWLLLGILLLGGSYLAWSARRQLRGLNKERAAAMRSLAGR